MKKIINFFRGLFSKKTHATENPKAVTDTTLPVKEYRVINGSDIEDVGEPEFNISHWVTEEIYKKDLEEALPYFEEFSKTGTIKKYPYNSLDDIQKHYDLNQKIHNVERNYMDSGNHVSVIETANGKYIAAVNGRHRLYVARKYNLKILVYVEHKLIS